MTDRGWREAGQLSGADVLALPRSYGRAAWPAKDVSEDAAYLLGLLLGNGWIGGTPAITMPAHDDPELFMEPARRAFGIDPHVRPERKTDRALRIVYTTGYRCGAGKNPMTTWLRSLGIWHKKAAEKRIPAALFQQPPEVIAALVAGLFQTDGSVGERRGRPTIKFNTVSEGLARDLQHALLRIGVNSNLCREKHEKDEVYRGQRIVSRQPFMWCLHIATSSFEAFRERVRLVGMKAEKMTSFRAKENDAAHMDRLPLTINGHVALRRAEAGLSHAGLGWRDQGKRMSRATAGAVALKLDLRQLVIELVRHG
jgi:replicative DNA helicase